MKSLDLAYALGLGITSPIWLIKPTLRRKVLSAFRERMGPPKTFVQASNSLTLLIHAVSNGELGATTRLIELLGTARPDLRFVVSTTTATGWQRSLEIYHGNARVSLIRYPLDFTWAVDRTLDRCGIDLAVLMELEVWPNFVDACFRRDIPIVLANGRITDKSFRGYRRILPIARALFGRISFVCAQEDRYAARFIRLGADPEQVRVLGTMKFDSAYIGDHVEGDRALAQAVGIDPAAGPVWVCGSTGPGEESLILQVYRALRIDHPSLRLVIVPRHVPRFDEVAALIVGAGFSIVRRSRPSDALDPTAIILGDTMGELRKFYSLATVVFVGRSLVDLGARQHGSDMIEPAALAKPCVVGPFTDNFAGPMSYFSAADAMSVCDSVDAMVAQLREWLQQPDAARAVGQRAQQVVQEQRGAAERHAEVILAQLVNAERLKRAR